MATDFNYANTITADTPAVASEVQGNFDDILDWIKTYYQQAEDTTTEIAAAIAAITATSWANVSFENSWVNLGSGYQSAQYRKVGDIVYLRGSIKDGSSGTTAFTLPANFRPPAHVQYATRGNVSGTVAFCTVFSSGAVEPVSSGFMASHTLDGISFSVTA
jgi:hypothetical protein